MASVVFPPTGSLTSEASIHVRGTASDSDTITNVTVNGVVATTSDAFAHWSAVVPLTLGSNTLTVATADNGGGADSNATSVTVLREAVLASARMKLAYHSASHTLLLANEPDNSLMKQDTQTGVRTALFTPAAGTPFSARQSQWAFDPTDGNVFYAVTTSDAKLLRYVIGAKTVSEIAPPSTKVLVAPSSVAINPAGTIAYVTDTNLKAIVSVNLATGAQTLFSTASPATGGGTSNTAFFTPGHLIYDVNTPYDRLLVCDTGDGASNGPRITEVRVSDGQRKVFSDNNDTGASYGLPFSIVAGTGNYANTAFIGIPNNGYLVALDTSDASTGVHPSFLRETQSGSGLDISFGNSIAFDSSDEALIIADRDSPDLVKATDADHTPSDDAFKAAYIDFGLGAGATIYSGRTAVFDQARSRIIATNEITTSKLVAVAPNGDRTAFGSTFGFRNNLRFDHVNDFIYTTNQSGNGALEKVAPDGTVTVVSGGATAPTFGTTTRSLAIDVANDRAWVVTGNTTMLKVVLSTGARSLMSISVSGGNQFSDITYDAVGSRLLFINQSQAAVFAVAATGGTASKISGGLTGEEVGGGTAKVGGSGIVVNAAGTTAWVSSVTGLVKVDLASGDRTEVSGTNVGTGPRMTTGLTHFDIDEARRLAVMPSSAYMGIIVADLDSGDRVIVSQ